MSGPGKSCSPPAPRTPTARTSRTTWCCWKRASARTARPAEAPEHVREKCLPVFRLEMPRPSKKPTPQTSGGRLRLPGATLLDAEDPGGEFRIDLGELRRHDLAHQPE